jgi:hypothetical protein
LKEKRKKDNNKQQQGINNIKNRHSKAPRKINKTFKKKKSKLMQIKILNK